MWSGTLWTAQISSTHNTSHLGTKNYHVIYKKKKICCN